MRRLDLVIIVGLLLIAFGILAGVITLPGMPDKVSDKLTEMLMLIIGGMLGHLSHQKAPAQEQKP